MRMQADNIACNPVVIRVHSTELRYCICIPSLTISVIETLNFPVHKAYDVCHTLCL